MLSIIICSRSPDISSALRSNIARTIGVPYELMVVDNSTAQMSIFSAYNIGIQNAQGDILCFVHDDIFFRTSDWGHALTQNFADCKYDAIGVAGSAYFPSLPIGWYATGVNSINIIHSSQPSSGIHVHTFQQVPHANANLTPVVALDGVFLAISRKALANIRFDAQTFSEFHGYDLDISFQLVSAGFKLAVTHSILLEHASIGTMNEVWLKAAFAIHNKWRHALPLEAYPLSIAQKQRSVIRSFLILIWIEFKSKVLCKYARQTILAMLDPKSRWAFTSWRAPFIGFSILLELSKIFKLLRKLRRPHL